MANKVVFSGVGKREDEMRLALQAGILCFNVESAAELERLNRVAGEMGKIAPVSLRVNPDVDAKTHPYISTGLKQSKFGVAYEEALPLYRRAAGMPHLRVTGIDCHIGSQITEVSPFIAAADKVLALVDKLAAQASRWIIWISAAVWVFAMTTRRRRRLQTMPRRCWAYCRGVPPDSSSNRAECWSAMPASC